MTSLNKKCSWTKCKRNATVILVNPLKKEKHYCWEHSLEILSIVESLQDTEMEKLYKMEHI